MNALELNDRLAGRGAARAEPIPADWLAEFEATARRPLDLRIHYALIRTCKPILGDTPFHTFETTADYRRWSEESLTDWLGYGHV